MRYLVRVLKYFIYVVVIMSVILAVLIALGFVEKDVNLLFRNGTDSIWKILLMFLAVSAIYPKFGFSRRGVIIPGSYDEIRPGVVEYMEDHGFVLESEEGENMTFRRKSILARITKVLGEDRICFTRDLPGFYIEGLTKDIVRISSGLEYRFRQEEQD